jgi:tetratricopeptide (TPR) repeat protein
MKNRNILPAIAAFALPFAIYISTMAPGVSFTDSGELAAVCTTLGVAHPTGYPLFTILGYLWTLLPLPFSPVMELNIFAGFITALSAMVFYFLTRDFLGFMNQKRIKRDKKDIKQKTKQLPQLEMTTIRILALISALAYSTGATIWAQGLSIEVYSLQLLMINLILWAILRASLFGNSSVRTFLLAAFLLGLGFANHMTTILIVPAFLYVYFRRPNEDPGDYRLLLWMIIPFAIGLGFYLYLPIRSAALPEFNWGWTHRSIDKFLYHVSGKQYQVWMFSDTSLWGENFMKFLSLATLQMGWIGIIPAIGGMVAVWKRSRRLFVFMILLLVTCVGYTLNYSIHDIDPYFSLAFIVLLMFMAVGIMRLIRSSPKFVYVALAIPLISFIINIDRNDQSENYLVEDYTRNLMENLEPDAVIISAQWDYWCSAFWYLQRVEGLRPDVALVEKELLRRTWYPKQLRLWYPEVAGICEGQIDEFEEYLERFESGKSYNSMQLQQSFMDMLNCFIDKNYPRRPIYITLDIMQTERGIADEYEKIPDGFAFRLEKEKRVYDVSVEDLDLERFINSDAGGGHLEEGIKQTAAVNLVNIGRYAQFTKDFETARKAFNLALKIDPNNRMARQGLGSINRQSGP